MHWFAARLVPGTDREYKKFWPTEEAAYDFGELILKALGRKAMGESTEAGGGVLVPDEMRLRIIDMIARYGKNASVVELGSASEWVPRIASDLTVYVLGEGAEITASDMGFNQVRLNTEDLYCACCCQQRIERR